MFLSGFMKFICSVPRDINQNETIVLPISMNQPLERGARLEAILNAIEMNGYKQKTTVLVCDYLNRHNCDSAIVALTQGNEFIEEHKQMLSGFRILHWKDFIDSINKNEFAIQAQKILDVSQIGSKFYNKMKKTWEKCLSAHQKLENSIQYQTEEYAAILCMSEFDHLFYPKKMNNGLSYLYGFVDGQKPKYHYVKINDSKNEQFFIGKSEISQNKTHLHIAFRCILQQMEILLTSAELSENSKKIFAEEAENLLMQHELLSNNDVARVNEDIH